MAAEVIGDVAVGGGVLHAVGFGDDAEAGGADHKVASEGGGSANQAPVSAARTGTCDPSGSEGVRDRTGGAGVLKSPFVIPDQPAAVAGGSAACYVSGREGGGDGAVVLADQPAAAAFASGARTIAGGVGVADLAGVSVSIDQPAVSAEGAGALTVARGIGVRDGAAVLFREGAAEDAEVGDRRICIDGTEEGRIARPEGDGVIMPVELSPEVGAGGPCPRHDQMRR